MKKIIFAFTLLMLVFMLTSCKKQLEIRNKNSKSELFSDGLMLACKLDKNGKLKYGYLNKKKKVVINFIYDDALGFNDGVAIVQLKDDFYLINTNGEIISNGYRYMWYDCSHYILDLEKKMIGDVFI